MRRSLALVAVLAMSLTACSGNSGSTSTTGDLSGFASEFDPRDLTFSARLVPFNACDAVLAHFKAEALERVGPYGLGGGPIWFGPVLAEGDFAEGGARDSAVTTAAGAPVPTGTEGGNGYSGTNVQVAGVDEPDIVKTDGNWIVSIIDGVMRYVDVTGGQPVLRDEVRLESGWGHRFFISGDRAFVFSQGDLWAIPMFAADAARIAPGGWGEPVSIVQEVDLSNPDALQVVRTVRLDGSYLSARAIGDTVRMVVSSYPHQLPFVYPSNSSAEEFALNANRQIIQDSKIETWLPGYTVYDAEGRETGSGLLVECSRMHRPEEFAGFDTLSVTTLDLGGALQVGNGTGVIAEGQTVYASTEALYVSTNVYIPDDAWERFPNDMEALEQTYETAIHKFDISGEGPAQYLASGSVEGHLLNQFAMDEHEGFLRVATTTGTPWGGEDSESQVVVLTERNGELAEVGSVGDMGDGERIYSVRFIGETGYVVTFRQVDPLYVLDLRDPENPTVSGELKIPGYSAYLHPLGDGLLLGVGQDADDEGRVLGAKATLFDVSDPANPRELGSWTKQDGYTDVEWDHLAFLYWAPEDVAVLPLNLWEEQFYGAVVLKTDDGLREFGRVSHHREEGATPTTDCRIVETSGDTKAAGMVVLVCEAEDIGGYAGTYCEQLPADEARAWVEESYGIELGEIADSERVELCWPDSTNQDPSIMRSIVIGDTLWTLSWRALQANRLSDLEVESTLWFG
jgi:uncharacterized secreted protein with C-terminal beta-propeller domain